MMIMSKHNQHHIVSFPCCLSGWYNSDTAIDQKLTLTV